MELEGFISIITTCKGRLKHLTQTMPNWRNQIGDNYEIIVVDYGDPDGSADYAEGLNDPRVRAVRHEAEGFNLSHARNLGALAASPKADTLLFIDADIFMTNHSFLNYHKKKILLDGTFVTGWGNGFAVLGYGVSGTCMVNKSEFLFVKGYNEVTIGWGSEDVELYERLERTGLKQVVFQNGLMAIAHDDWERTMFYQHKNIHEGNEKNARILRKEFRSVIP